VERSARSSLDPQPGSLESARAAGLRYVTDCSPGIRRKMGPLGFEYFGPDGSRITDEAELARIRTLVIPPAWNDVWICSTPRGHLQATGRDARGRKQYRYHARWRSVRDETKYDRMIAFGEALPRIRARTERDLGVPGLPREKVLAAVVELLARTLIRVGNDEYARANRSFGLTTLRDRHVEVNGAEVTFEFRGKSGKSHAVRLRSRRLAAIVRRCRDLPGYELFQYIDGDGDRQVVDSADVNAYLREVAGEEFTAKDFRTWAGTVLAVRALLAQPAPESPTHVKKNVTQAVQAVSGVLGNTPAVCRKCYVHPAVFDAYEDGSLLETLGPLDEDPLARFDDLQPDERRVLRFLRARLKADAKRGAAA
jgi:DNA topoisomerase-1